MEMKFCRDCRNFRCWSLPLEPSCMAPYLPGIMPVREASDCRADSTACGLDGKWFIPIPESRQQPTVIERVIEWLK